MRTNIFGNKFYYLVILQYLFIYLYLYLFILPFSFCACADCSVKCNNLRIPISNWSIDWKTKSLANSFWSGLIDKTKHHSGYHTNRSSVHLQWISYILLPLEKESFHQPHMHLFAFSPLMEHFPLEDMCEIYGISSTDNQLQQCIEKNSELTSWSFLKQTLGCNHFWEWT